MMDYRFLGILALCGLLTGCGGKLVELGQKEAPIVDTTIERGKFWEGLSEPHDTFEAYVKALKRDRYQQAASYIYMKNREKSEQTVITRMPDLSATIKREDWQIKILSAAKEGRFAAIIFSTTPQEDDPSPILLIREDERWYMHYYEHSGRLANILEEESDLAQAKQLVDWGKRKVQEIKNKVKGNQAQPKVGS